MEILIAQSSDSVAVKVLLFAVVAGLTVFFVWKVVKVVRKRNS